MTLTSFLAPSRIVVLGDIMIDSYLRGSVTRISPEAPVPVLRFAGEAETLGGAANVALNLKALGGDPLLIGVTGMDDTARRLGVILDRAGIDASLVSSADRPTTIKTRILAAQRQQMLRIDREVVGPLPTDVEAQVIERVSAALHGAHALILSDYAKGCLTDRVLVAVIAAARKAGVQVLVDPKRSDFTAYTGADYIKPNLSELAKATGLDCDSDEATDRAAHMLVAQTGAAILLTRSERGMCLYARDGSDKVSLPTEAREVFDVSGAGDTVMATFTLAIAGGAAPRQAMRLANVAAGIVVSKVGTATVGRDELMEALADHGAHDPAHPKVLSRAAAARLVREWQAQGLCVGFTNGCFDLLHPGHIAILRGAAAECDRLIVGLNSDASVSRLKGPTRPIQSQQARAEVMAAIAVVDAVTIFDEDTPLETLTALLPDVVIKGADYTEEQIVGGDVVKARGGRVARVPLVSGQSTTSLVTRSSQGASA